MSVHQLLLRGTLPSAPSATRAVPISLSAHGTLLAYGSNNNVVIRDVNNPNLVSLCGCHTSPVTAVRISPTGRLVASGDQNGNLIVWQQQEQKQQPQPQHPLEPREVLNSKQLQGPVRDIAWTGDEERLVVVGDGKSTFAVAITITANTIGTINGHSQNILTCDMRLERPYRIVTGGADALVGFYEGVPFKFKCNVKGHTGKVTCVRYSPDMETIATVSGSSDVILLDGKTADKKSSIATGHKGTIYAVAWSPDGSKIATASADKSVKIFDAVTGATLSSFSLGNDVMDMQQGLVYTSQCVISASLGGKLTYMCEEGVKNVVSGHQGRILMLHKESNGTFISVSVERVLIWNCTADGIPGNAREVSVSSNTIIAATFSNGYLFLVSGGNLLRYALTDTEPTVLSKEASNATALTVTADGNIVLLAKNSFIIIDATGKKMAEEKMNQFDGISAASHNYTVVLGGDKVVKGYRIQSNAAPSLCVEFAGHHTGMVACVAFSKDGQCVASGDASRNIFVWSALDGSVLYKDLVFHTLRVTSLAFSHSSNTELFSGSMDASLIVWNLKAKTRRMEDAAHRGGVSAVAWAEDGTLFSGGSDFCIRQWGVSS
ncbi:WD40 repeat-containing protein [Trypanosoma theileri]|uniref:WD40 repeat-containing protein n=1 Tax=Trypanosoma theileri TaxID=67003 RepID=A0A1X0P016_9TRYP|nr:WD40 repeat-containing protein [Trypanosoma theileri]ORC90286.1 WD40 repeat-containing protein [Trypanosoma theileri]